MTPSNSTAHDIGGFEETTRAGDTLTHQSRLSYEGRAWADIRADLIARKASDFNWRAGRLPIYVYYDNDELLAVARDAYALYFTENALGRRAFPSLAGMEDEVIRMALALFNAPTGADGSFTSGGTESIFLACKAARDCFRATRGKGVVPAMVLPVTAHPAFDKAASYLHVDVVRVETGEGLRSDVAKMSRAIDGRTMMIVGSAPCYPYGVFDSIELLSHVARSAGVWMHVDACLGGFLAPFARDEGYEIPPFDFSLPGISSLSADIHKFGFSARGASVVLYRSASLKAYQRFDFSNWPRGSYSTDTFLGSRPGGAIASAWAVMNYLGRKGYRQLAIRTMQAARHLRAGINAIPGLQALSPSELNIVLYRSIDPRLDINAVGDALTESGWFVGRVRKPPALHLALNPVHAPVIEQYLADLKRAVAQTRASGRTSTHDDMTY